jgi:lipid-binding SYLF domain-containing protein
MAAGPVGRDAEAATDIRMRAQILSYSRSRGFFAGATLKGSAITSDSDANRDFYGRKLSTNQIVYEGIGSTVDPVPAWNAMLKKYF